MADALSFIEDHVGLVAFLGLVAFMLLAMVASSTFRRKVLAVLATAWLWFAFWGGNSVVLILQLLFLCTVGWMLPTSSRRKGLSLCQGVALFLLVSGNPFWWVKRHGKRNSPPPGSIIVCNHLCYLDAWIIASKLFPITPIFVAMAPLFSMPVFGQVMKLSGHIPVHFEKREDGTKRVKKGANDDIMRRAKEALDMGFRVVVFPEGTLSHTGHLKEFRDGFFRLSYENGYPIFPVASFGQALLFPPGDQYGTAHPGRAHIKSGDIIDPSAFDSPEQLRDFTRTVIRDLRNSLPNMDLDIKERPTSLALTALEPEL